MIEVFYMILILIIILTVIVSVSLFSRFENNYPVETETETETCNYIPMGTTKNQCIEQCIDLSDNLTIMEKGFGSCYKDRCIDKCNGCNDNEKCLWINNPKVFSKSEIILKGEFIQDPEIPKIILKWKIEPIDDKIIRDMLKYDNDETKIQKLLDDELIVKQSNECKYPVNQTTCSSLAYDLQDSNLTTRLQDETDTTNPNFKGFLCDKKLPESFNIIFSHSNNNFNTHRIIKVDTNQLTIEDDYYTYELCIVNKEYKTDNCVNIEFANKYIFFISDTNKLLTSKFKVISTLNI